jgi:hypothetical protein
LSSAVLAPPAPGAVLVLLRSKQMRLLFGLPTHTIRYPEERE